MQQDSQIVANHFTLPFFRVEPTELESHKKRTTSKISIPNGFSTWELVAFSELDREGFLGKDHLQKGEGQEVRDV